MSASNSHISLLDGRSIERSLVKGIECKFATYLKAPGFREDDYHMVKESIELLDGTKIPNIRYIKNYTRPYYITKPSARRHTEKKEWDDIDNLMRYEARQSDLVFNLAKALEDRTPGNYLSKLCGSPYVYGADISSTTHLRHQYRTQYPDLQTKYRVAAYDIETGVVPGPLFDTVLAISVTLENDCWLFVSAPFLEGEPNYLQRFEAKKREVLVKYQVEDRFKVHFVVCEDEVEAIRKSFQILHEKMPDIVSIWSMSFDIPFIIRRLEHHDIDPASVLCDPSVPKNYRQCYFKEGRAKSVTSSGKVKPINPASRWHVFYLSASFTVLDSMCCYKQIRLSKQEEPSYRLEAILNLELGIGKLQHPDTMHLDGLDVHIAMQSQYKVDYLVYNIIDTIALLLLDEKTNDLSFNVPTMSGHTDFENFNSQTKKISVALYYYLLAKGKVLGSTGKAPSTKVLPEFRDDDEEEEEDDEILSLKRWIVTLKSAMLVGGTELASDLPGHVTPLRCFNQDCDMTGAYPSCVQAMNVSKETTAREIIAIRGVDEEVFRLRNIDIVSSAKMNSYRYSTEMFQMPTFQQLEALF